MRLMYDRISVVQSLLHFKTRTPSGGNGSFLLSRSGGRMKQVFMESPEEALRRLGTDGTNGLTPEQVAESRLLYGSNALTGKKPDSLLKRIWNASCEPMLIMLILAAVIASGVNIARRLFRRRGEFSGMPGDFCGDLSFRGDHGRDGRQEREGI